MSSKAIVLNNVSKCYHVYQTNKDRIFQLINISDKEYFKKFWALKNISFEVKKGETLGVVGLNGSGKSTLLQIICGTVSTTTGEVNTQGRIAALLELGAGFNVEFTGLENIYINGSILGLSKSEINQCIEDIIEFSELREFINLPVKTYSSGMYSRLAFSIAIHVKPDILVVDETLAVGDARFVAKCMQRVKEIKHNGCTILFVSHDINFIRAICDRVIWLDKGEVVADGDVSTVTGNFLESVFSDQNKDESNSYEIVSGEINEKPKPVKKLYINKKPFIHWGSHKGLILTASILDKDKVNKSVHTWGDQVEILIEVNIPVTIPRNHLRIAFSIKDLKGIDILVATTQDLDNQELPHDERFSVSFRFVNILVDGEYVLAAAIENTEDCQMKYYEYIEGLQYFTSLTNEKLFGIFHPIIEKKICVN